MKKIVWSRKVLLFRKGSSCVPEVGSVIIEELAAVLRRLHDSPAERAALADRALRRVGERFAWSAVAKATVEQYRAAMGPKASRPEASQPGTGQPETGEPEAMGPEGPARC